MKTHSSILRPLRRIFLPAFALLAAGSLFGEPEESPKRVLFVGNSYTSQVKAQLVGMLAQSGHKDAEFEFIVKGGATLQRHLGNKETLARIRDGKWDVVIMQEQSQTPALPGAHGKSFQDCADELCKLIKKSGAKPVFYMTWGRRDGDAKNKKIFPDYTTMQELLSDAYRKAAKRNKAVIVPVGEAWARVRKEDKALGEALYKGDGSHPSAKGACLVAAVFLRVLFDDPLETAPMGDVVKAGEWKILRDAAMEVSRR